MGATCSSTARSRFESIKTLVMRKACLTSYSATGLLPRGLNGPVIWMFGEDHDTNEATKHAAAVRGLHESERASVRGKNCLLLLDVAREAASSCGDDETAGADVVFLYENAVIDSQFGDWADPNEWQTGQKTGLIASRHALKSLIATKEMAENRKTINANPSLPDPLFPRALENMPKSLDSLGRVRLANDNIRPVPMDVFHRIRTAVMTGYRVADVYSPSIAVTELKGFWRSVGYDVPDLLSICAQAESLARQHSVYFNSQQIDVQTQVDIYDALVCANLATLSLEIRESNEAEYGWKAGKTMALRKLDDLVAALFNKSCIFSPSLKITSREIFEGDLAPKMGIPEPQESDYRHFALNQIAFQLIGLSGDIIVYEYLGSLVSSKKNSTVVLMNAGHMHVETIRRWLVSGGLYDVAHERLSDDSLLDKDFVENRTF